MARKLKASESGAYSLKAQYCALWRQLQSVTQRTGGNPDESIVTEVKGSLIEVRTGETCLELKGIQTRSSTGIDVVDVHVAFQQIVRPTEPPTIEKSMVKITYLGARKGQPHNKVLETWHFDYSPATRAHPIHHAQLTEDHLLNGPTGRTFQPPYRQPDLRDAPRVPSAPMDLPALAAMLVNDHFPDRLEQLDDDDWKAASRLPQFSGQHFQDAGLGRSPTARDWYPA